MKRTVSLNLLLLVICVFVCSCNGQSSLSFNLREAERLMDSHPDSSLMILEQIEHPESYSQKEYALWCLLYTQAKDKNYIEHTSDSIIGIAVNYFEGKKDEINLMKAYYYTAVVWHEIGDSPRAQEFYLRALDVGKNSGNHSLLGRIYFNLGSIYTYQNLYDVALEYEKKALDHFLVIKDSTSIGLSFRNIGRVYSKGNQLDSSIVYYTKALPYLTLANQASIYNEIGSLYRHLRQYSKALEYAELALASVTTGDEITTVYHNLGDIYRLTNQLDSARYYFQRSLESDNAYTRAGAYMGLAYIEEELQNWPAYVQYHKKSISLRDSINRKTQAQDVQRIQSLYNYEHVEKERLLYQQRADKIALQLYHLTAICIIVSAVFITLFLFYRRKRQKEKERTERALRLFQQRQRQTQEYMRKKLYELEFALSDKQENQVKEKEKRFYSSDLYQKLSKEDTRLLDHEWEELEKWINHLCPDFTDRLRELYPLISTQELRLCILKKMGISVKCISNLLYISSQGVSKKWQRLYRKITYQDGSANDMDDFIGAF